MLLFHLLCVCVCFRHGVTEGVGINVAAVAGIIHKFDLTIMSNEQLCTKFDFRSFHSSFIFIWSSAIIYVKRIDT